MDNLNKCMVSAKSKKSKKHETKKVHHSMKETDSYFGLIISFSQFRVYHGPYREIDQWQNTAVFRGQASKSNI